MIAKADVIAFHLKNKSIKKADLKNLDILKGSDGSIELRKRGTTITVEELMAELPDAPDKITVSTTAVKKGVTEGILQNDVLSGIFVNDFPSKDGRYHLVQYRDASAQSDDPISKALREDAEAAKAKAAATDGNADYPV